MVDAIYGFEYRRHFSRSGLGALPVNQSHIKQQINWTKWLYKKAITVSNQYIGVTKAQRKKHKLFRILNYKTDTVSFFAPINRNSSKFCLNVKYRSRDHLNNLTYFTTYLYTFYSRKLDFICQNRRFLFT